MNKLPRILIRVNKKGETKLFLKFLNHPEFPQHKQLILRAFPDLREMLKDSVNETRTIQKFIDQFYLKHQRATALAFKESLKEMESGTRAIKTLGNVMNFSWRKNIIYIATPTILPFSPFGKNIFYFSILDRVFGTSKRNILVVAIHEISHFVFFDLLKKIEKKEKFSLSTDAKYYGKEILTTALFNEEPLRNILKINNYLGNPDVRDIYIIDQNKLTENLINYTREKYLKSKKDGEDFKKFLTEFTKMLYGISKELSQKRFIWNCYGNKLFKNKKALTSYKKPIKLKMA